VAGRLELQFQKIDGVDPAARVLVSRSYHTMQVSRGQEANARHQGCGRQGGESMLLYSHSWNTEGE
jgi:hypothetical protein